MLDRRRFDDALLDELLEVAAKTVFIDGDAVVIKHCYAERRVTPLNVFLRQADADDAQAAAVDYGHAIKDLAKTNLFPGDLLLKNFGVTQQNRVVFYDYDEVCACLPTATFAKCPQSDVYDDEIAAEPWFGVGPQDVFPEELVNFLGLTSDLRRAFLDRHGDLFEPEYWIELHQRLVAGEILPRTALRCGQASDLCQRRRKRRDDRYFRHDRSLADRFFDDLISGMLG